VFERQRDRQTERGKGKRRRGKEETGEKVRGRESTL
jgi:hypothetical protein